MGKSIQIKNLTFAYDKQKILKQINLVIGRETFLSIIGPNGSGKTTLLKNIARNLKPTTGSVLIDKKELSAYSISELARDLSVVHQNPEIVVEFTVYDVVTMGRNPYVRRFQAESQHDFEIVEKALHWTNTFHLQHRYINEISGGERQRVMIAKALAQEPKVLLLDEPTSFLDIHHQVEIMELLKRLNREKHISVIAVIHDLNLAARYSEEVLLLHEGNVVTLGATDKVMTVDNLQKAYEMEMIVDRNAYTGTLQVCPLSIRKKKVTDSQRVHVITGGGTGRELLQKLYQQGFTVSVGVLNRGDSDCELSHKLGFDVIEEEPFQEIKQNTFEIANKTASQSSAVILTSIPIGSGNLINLSIAVHQIDQGKPVFLYDTYNDSKTFDYTNGKGMAVLQKLKEKGMKVFDDLDKIMEKLEADD